MTLPSRERLEELRDAHVASTSGRSFGLATIAADEQLALLDAALTLRRLEEWLRGPHGLWLDVRVLDTDVAPEPNRVQVALADRSEDHEVRGPDLLSALRAALDNAE